MPFIERQGLFEQGEISIAETFSCLATMLPDCLFLQGAPQPGGSILPFELLQFKQVFRQHCFPLIQCRHRFSLLVNPLRIPVWWTHMLHVPAHDKAPHVTCSIRQAYQRQQEEPDSCWSPGESEAPVHQAPFFNPGNPCEEDELREHSSDVYGELLQVSSHNGI